MDLANESPSQDLILLGISDEPWLELPLFVVFLVSYILTILGNVTIILLCRLDPRLHTPIYFFLTNLSLLDLCYTNNTIPQMIANLHTTRRTISYAACVAQVFIFLALGCTDCLCPPRCLSEVSEGNINTRRQISFQKNSDKLIPLGLDAPQTMNCQLHTAYQPPSQTLTNPQSLEFLFGFVG
ncbi:olfactory receptor 11-like [Tachyglossus aculeatus]|uniref:olfactory receptor 11-like n=1 Tax=Tachyglossus aculeatus TaxID=9261 RepID=UPI0018F65193|nr:olfactory receptor 11-like [Tachyglossus aculeatus]